MCNSSVVLEDLFSFVEFLNNSLIYTSFLHKWLTFLGKSRFTGNAVYTDEFDISKKSISLPSVNRHKDTIILGKGM